MSKDRIQEIENEILSKHGIDGNKEAFASASAVFCYNPEAIIKKLMLYKTEWEKSLEKTKVFNWSPTCDKRDQSKDK